MFIEEKRGRQNWKLITKTVFPSLALLDTENPDFGKQNASDWKWSMAQHCHTCDVWSLSSLCTCRLSEVLIPNWATLSNINCTMNSHINLCSSDRVYSKAFPPVQSQTSWCIHTVWPGPLLLAVQNDIFFLNVRKLTMNISRLNVGHSIYINPAQKALCKILLTANYVASHGKLANEVKFKFMWPMKYKYMFYRL